MNRRAFLKALGFGTVAAAAAATSTLDVERLFWAPGEKTIVLPPAQVFRECLDVGDIITIDGLFAINPVTRQYTPYLQQFVVRADVRADEPLVKIYPSIRTEGIYQNVGIVRKGVRVIGKRISSSPSSPFETINRDHFPVNRLGWPT
jgi:hypothetical protein